MRAMDGLGIGWDAALRPSVEERLQHLQADPPCAPARREACVEAAVAATFLAAAAALALLPGWERSLSAVEVVVAVLAYALVFRVEFAAGAGSAVPTQLVLVPMLFILPTPVVPLVVAAGVVAANVPDYVQGRRHPGRAVLTLGDAWHAVGPAFVLVVAGAQTFDWSNWPVYVLALGAQFAVDFTVSTLREWLGLGLAPRIQPALLGWVYLVDVLLAPAGLLAAAAAAERPETGLLILPTVGLLAVFAREREARVEAALELGQTYRGTAMLLGDVLEGSDEYTGEHSRSVVLLACEVAETMGLDDREMRNVEFAALLHDVGKISIPLEIIHKRGPLDPSEWRVMKTHTIEGHRMLRRVGGVLAEVGHVVRASHERWDGGGYPDGIAGEAIPVEASIVSCCDAFDAMTTDRPYRPAMLVGDAVAELRRNAGTQFRPDVVETLVGVLGERGLLEPERRLALVA